MVAQPVLMEARPKIAHCDAVAKRSGSRLCGASLRAAPRPGHEILRVPDAVPRATLLRRAGTQARASDDYTFAQCAINLSTNPAHFSSSAISTNSSGVCACAIDPGPITTEGISAMLANRLASVPKATLAWSLRPARLLASVTMAASAVVSRAG